MKHIRVSAVNVREMHCLIKMPGNCQGNLVLICIFRGNVREILLLSLTSKNVAVYFDHHFHPCSIIYSVKYIWWTSQRSSRSMISARRAFSNVVEEVNSIHFLARSTRVFKAFSFLHEQCH